MGVRVAVTKKEINGFMVGLANLIGNRHGNLVGAECEITTSWNGKWKETDVMLRGERRAWLFMGNRTKHLDGRIRGSLWDFTGDRDAFVRWVFMLEAMAGLKIKIPDDWRAVVAGEREVT
jgi:hypothetical protein